MNKTQIDRMVDIDFGGSGTLKERLYKHYKVNEENEEEKKDIEN